MLGMGFGLTMVPCLHLLLGQTMKEAVRSSLFLHVPISIFSLLIHYANPQDVFDILGWVILGSLVGIELGLWLRNIVSAKVLKVAFCLLLIFILMRQYGLMDGFHLEAKLDDLQIYHHIVLGLVAATLSVTMGIGGGVVLVTVYVLMLSMNPKSATFLSLHVISLNAVLSSYRTRSEFIWYPYYKHIFVFGCLGGLAGKLVFTWISVDLMKTVFGIFLLLVLARMLASLWQDSGEAHAQS